jgi:hypothetical protein
MREICTFQYIGNFQNRSSVFLEEARISLEFILQPKLILIKSKEKHFIDFPKVSNLRHDNSR